MRVLPFRVAPFDNGMYVVIDDRRDAIVIDPGQMERSLERVAALPPPTRVYPGHGPPTTIGDEIGWLRGSLTRGGLFRGG